MLRAMNSTSNGRRALTRGAALSLVVLLAVLLAVLTAAGCAYGNAQQVVHSQFAAELNCPDATIKARQTYDEGYKDGQYVVRGCNVVRTYSCPKSDGLMSYDDKSCSFVNGLMGAVAEQPKAQTGSSADDFTPPEAGGAAAEPEAAKPAPKPAAKPATKPAKPSPFRAEPKAAPAAAVAAPETASETAEPAPNESKPSPFKTPVKAKSKAKKK